MKITKTKKSLKEILYVLLLLLAMIILFYWYTSQNRARVIEQNKNYASDSAKQTAEQINDEFDNALNLINAYSYLVGKSLTEPAITPQMLAEMEETSQFDNLFFTDLNGMEYASDGRTANASSRAYFSDGINGNSNITIIFDPYFSEETVTSFYAPVYFEGKITGILRGVYLAEQYLQSMLDTTYFGEQADTFLCTPDGGVIANSNDQIYQGNLIDLLTESGVIDENTAAKAKDIFTNGGTGSFVCSEECKTDNICVINFPDKDCVLVQIFPKNVTQDMIRTENLVGIQLEIMLIGLFIIYIITLLEGV